MPGYEDQVIMAAGTFVQGASIELSADGPIREPQTGVCQAQLDAAGDHDKHLRPIEGVPASAFNGAH